MDFLIRRFGMFTFNMHNPEEGSNAETSDKKSFSVQRTIFIPIIY